MANKWLTLETVRDFIYLFIFGLQSHCRWWLQLWNKRCFLLGRKVMTNLDSMLKSRDITLPTKVLLVKATDVPVVMFGCESWTIKSAKHQRIIAFKLWCWWKLLRVLWTARRSNQSILKDISWIVIGRTDVEAETPIFWPPDAKSGFIWKPLMLGKIEGRRRRGG